jgi:hypothetical protein
MDVLEDYLEGKALDFWQIKRKEWINGTFEEAMDALKLNYRSTLSDRQAMAIFDKEKPSHRGYKEHLTYLLQVNAAGGGHYSRNVLMSIVHRSGADLVHEIASKYERTRTDYIAHATELADYADELWNQRNLTKHTGRSTREGSQVNSVNAKKDKPTCTHCKRKGHHEKECFVKHPEKRPASTKKVEPKDKNKDKEDEFALWSITLTVKKISPMPLKLCLPKSNGYSTQDVESI